jgi:hypothetical protein
MMFQGRHLIEVVLSGNVHDDDKTCRNAISQLGIDFDDIKYTSFSFRFTFPTGDILELDHPEVFKIFDIRSLKGARLEVYFKLQRSTGEKEESHMNTDSNNVPLALLDEVVAELDHSCCSVGFEEKVTILRGTKGTIVSFDEMSGKYPIAQDAEIMWYGYNKKYWLFPESRRNVKVVGSATRAPLLHRVTGKKALSIQNLRAWRGCQS